MKKIILMLAVMLTLAACAEAWIPVQVAPESSDEVLVAVMDTAQPENLDVQPASGMADFDAAKGNGKAISMPTVSDENAADAAAEETDTNQDQPTENLPEGQETNAAEEQPATQEPPDAPESTPAPEMTPQPEPQSIAAPAPTAYGSIPFELTAGTGTWWKIDATDSAYWAVQENINAMRAAGGLPDLSMDDSLSSIASARCESFVMGGPFDHSGMVTRSEICAAGPLGSASAVCSAWQASDAHYANIMRSDISHMGVGCWFCDIGGNRYTYWVVTFE